MKTLGAVASNVWIDERGLDVSRTPHWYVEITLVARERDDARFELNIFPEEWGFVLRIGARVSSIRVTDIPFIHGRDDHALLRRTPELARIGSLIAHVEIAKRLSFVRTDAAVKSNLVRAASVIRTWLHTT